MKAFESMKTKQSNSDERMLELEKRFSSLSDQSRFKNLILFGLEDSESVNRDLIHSVLEIFSDMGLRIPDVAVEDSFRLGKVMGSRPIKIKFISSRWVRVAFDRVEEFKNFNLAIANDRTKEEREKHRDLRDRVVRLRNLGMNAKIRNKTLIINEKPIDLICADQLLTEYQLKEDDMITDNLNHAENTPKNKEPRKLGTPDLRKRKLQDQLQVKTNKKGKPSKTAENLNQSSTLDNFFKSISPPSAVENQPRSDYHPEKSGPSKD